MNVRRILMWSDSSWSHFLKWGQLMRSDNGSIGSFRRWRLILVPALIFINFNNRRCLLNNFGRLSECNGLINYLSITWLGGSFSRVVMHSPLVYFLCLLLVGLWLEIRLESIPFNAVLMSCLRIINTALLNNFLQVHQGHLIVSSYWMIIVLVAVLLLLNSLNRDLI